MGKVKDKLQEISELIQSLLDSGIPLENIDKVIEKELNLADFAFYLENKDVILNLFEAQHFQRGLDPKDAMSIGINRPFRSGEKLLILSKIDMKPFDSGFYIRTQSDGGIVLTSKTQGEVVLRPKYIIRPEDVKESFYPTLFESEQTDHFDEIENEENDYQEDEDNYEEEQEDKTAPSAHKDAPHLYWNNEGTYEKEYEKYWKELIPISGNADTIQGELLRCISSIIHDRYNNGFGNDKEDEARQLYKYKEKFIPYLKNPDAFNRFYRYYNDINFGSGRYVENNWIGDVFFDGIVDAIIKYIMNSEELESLPEMDKYFKQ